MSCSWEDVLGVCSVYAIDVTVVVHACMHDDSTTESARPQLDSRVGGAVNVSHIPFIPRGAPLDDSNGPTDSCHSSVDHYLIPDRPGGNTQLSRRFHPPSRY